MSIKLPSGRLGRLAHLAALGVRTGANVLSKNRAEAAAEDAARVLGNLRGLAAKVGQMASYVDGVVPEDHRPAFEKSLSALRSQAPVSPPAQVRAVLEQELGAPLNELFQSFDESPFASASIGQVHRATMPDGTPVAVKVQHPGIRDAVESDLSNAGLIETVVGTMGGKRFDSKSLLETIKARFREELDYELEAQRVLAFAALHEGDPHIRVPVLVPARCSRSVLTTEFVAGMTFDEICELPEVEREAWARTLWRFVFKGNLVLGMFNADPHPGNYIFHPEGAVTFLDYGCVQSIPKARKAHARAMHRAAIEGDSENFAVHLKQMIGAKPGPLADMAVDYTKICFAPLFEAPYRITRPYAANLVDGMKDMAKVAKDLPHEQFFTMPKEMLFMNRLQFGFYSVLARLDVSVDYAQVEREILGEPDEATA